MKGKDVLRVLAFPLLLGAVLLAVKSQDDHSGIPTVGFKTQEVRQVQAETVFLGSSHVYRHVDAARFDSVQGGGTSYNFGLQGATGLEIHYQAEQILELPHVERLVLELGTIERRSELSNPDTRRTYYYHDLRHVWLASRATLAFDLPLHERLRTILERIGIALDHYFLPGQGDDVLTEMVTEPRPVPGRQGFQALDDAAGTKRRRRFFLEDEGQAEFARRVEQVRQLRRQSVTPTRADSVVAAMWLDLYRRAEERGVEVYFVEVLGEMQDLRGIIRLLEAALPPGHVFVLNDPDRYPQLADPDLWFDRGHLNRRGARLYTDLLVELLPPGP